MDNKVRVSTLSNVSERGLESFVLMYEFSNKRLITATAFDIIISSIFVVFSSFVEE